jgi:hypothetical protein
MGQLINHTLPNINQGVSQQHDESRQETQVEEMINCIPDISRGIFRRNPFSTIATSTTTFDDTPNFYTHIFNRSVDETYQVSINGEGDLLVKDTADGTTKLSVTADSYLTTTGTDPYPNTYDSFSALNIKDFIFLVNKNKVVDYTAAVDGTADSELSKAVYWIKDTTAIVTDSFTKGTTDDTSTVSNYEGYTYTLNGVSVTASRTYTWNATTSTFDLLEGDDIILCQITSRIMKNKYCLSLQKKRF